MHCDREPAWRRRAALAAAVLAVLVLASPVLGASPKPGGVYKGTLVNEDAVQLSVSADGKSATVTVGCLDLGETYPFARFPIVRGTFNTTIPYPGSPLTAEASLRGKFASATQVSIVLNEHADRDADRYLCFGITSPATLTLKQGK